MSGSGWEGNKSACGNSYAIVRCATPLRAEGARIQGYWLTLTRSPREPHLPRLSIRIRHSVLVSGATIACSFHFRLTSLHIRLKDITRSITIVTLAPYCLPTPPFQVSFATVQRSLRSDAPPQNPSCSLPTLVDAAHTRRGLPSANIDGFCTLPVSPLYYCSLFLAILLFFFLASTIPHLSASPCPVPLRVLCFLSSTSPHLFSLLSLCSGSRVLLTL